MARPDLPWDSDSAGRSSYAVQNQRIKEAKRVCWFVCPVRERCLADAERTERTIYDVRGIRGGLTVPERLQRRDARPAPEPAPPVEGVPCPECGEAKSPRGMGAHRARVHGVVPDCGTPAGYRRHRDLGTETCPECRAAVLAYNNERQAARRKAGLC